MMRQRLNDLHAILKRLKAATLFEKAQIAEAAVGKSYELLVEIVSEIEAIQQQQCTSSKGESTNGQ